VARWRRGGDLVGVFGLLVLCEMDSHSSFESIGHYSFCVENLSREATIGGFSGVRERVNNFRDSPLCTVHMYALGQPGLKLL
jgi:hypothetical protein